MSTQELANKVVEEVKIRVSQDTTGDKMKKVRDIAFWVYVATSVVASTAFPFTLPLWLVKIAGLLAYTSGIIATGAALDKSKVKTK